MTKVKSKQKQKQKQNQTVIVNVSQSKRGRARSKQSGSKQSGSKQPPQPPQFMPYPVPNLRGPDAVVPSQASLIQLLERLQPLQAQMKPVPVQAPVPHLIVEEKQEVGPLRMVTDSEAFYKPEAPLVTAGPSSSSSSSSSSLDFLTEQQLMSMVVGKKDAQPGRESLRAYAKELGVIVPRKSNKQEYIEMIMKKLSEM